MNNSSGQYSSRLLLLSALFSSFSQTEKMLTEEDISQMNVSQLRNELARFGKSSKGNKNVLQKRLIELVTEGSDGNNSEDFDMNSDSGGRRRQSGTANKNESMFTFKDVEESLETFSGDDDVSVTKWLRDFEDMAQLLKWNDLQKIIYARRLLKGSAKLFMNVEGKIDSWNRMKEYLLAEFKIRVNSAVIHKRLTTRVKKTDESFRQYFYSMREIADQADLEEDALMTYIIAGIRDNECNKIILYDAKNLEELKEKLKVYERFKQNSRQSTSNNYSEQQKNSTTAKVHTNLPNRKKCFICNEEGHERKDCPNKVKGIKCYNCQEFGHISSKCPRKSECDSNARSVCVMSGGKLLKTVNVAGKFIDALWDTGSQSTCMTEICFKTLNVGKVNDSFQFVSGVGGTLVKVLGECTLQILIDNDYFIEDVLILPNDALTVPMLIGITLMNQAIVTIDAKSNSVSITKRVNLSVGTGQMCNDVSNDNEGARAIMAIDVTDTELDVEQKFRQDVSEIIANYKPVINAPTPIETKIIVNNDKPIFQRPRRLAPSEKKVVTDQIQEWLRNGIIRESFSEYASPVVVVKKKNGKSRVCIDYRLLNRSVVRDHFPMPLIEDQIDKLTGACVFSILDLENAFFHVSVEKESQKYTSFVTYDGQYEFLKTPFGLSVSPSSFLRYVNYVFRDLIRTNIVIAYMDDIIIPSSNEADGLTNLKQVLEVAMHAGLKINWSKCLFLKRKVEFLGFEIEDGTIKPSPNTVKPVQNFPIPSNATDVQRFLGLCGFFRKFIKNFAVVARPLYELVKKDAQFKFLNDELIAFNSLKKYLCSEPVLRIYDSRATTELHTDASADGYGAVLLQKRDGEDVFHPVYFLSKKTKPAESKYHSHELELLAVVYAFKKLRVYLLGLKVTVVTDCVAIKGTMSKADLVPRIARWVLLLEDFDYEIKHRAGVRMKHADALSRCVMIVDNKVIDLIKECQLKDERLIPIMKILKSESYGDFVMCGGLLMKSINGKNVLVVPHEMQKDILQKVHDNGHFGVKKMSEIVCLDYFVPKLSEKLEKVVRNCVTCILAERKRGKKEGFLRPIPKGDAPLLTYHIDHLGPMTATGKMYKYLFVVTDAFSKFVWIYSTKTTGVKEALDKLILQQKTFGNPQRIICDRGSAFTANDFKEYCETEGIELTLTTTGVPRGNGQVERMNGVITAVLTKLSQERPEKWYLFVDRLQRCINSTFQRTIKRSPFEVLLGVKIKQKEDVHILEILQDELMEEFMNDRDGLRQTVRLSIEQCQEDQRREHNRKCKSSHQYQVGDKVAIKRTQFGTGLKLKGKFLGPYKVVKRIGCDRYDVQRLGCSEGPASTSSSADNMKPWSIDDSSGTDD